MARLRRTLSLAFGLLSLVAVPSRADLLAYWPLDEGAGPVALDRSDAGRDATFEGTPLWVPGRSGTAAHFDGTNRLRHDLGTTQDLAAFTVAFWIRTDVPGQAAYSGAFNGYSPNTAGFQIDVDGSDHYRVHPGAIAIGDVSADWVHLAVVAEGTGATVYYNGEAAGQGTLADTLFNQLVLGMNRGGDIPLICDVDEFRFYDEALDAETLRTTLTSTGSYPHAFGPDPAPGSLVPKTVVSLSWHAGDRAAAHDVYLGTDPQAVGAGDASVFRGRLTETGFLAGIPGGPYPSPLEPGTTYTWRVDEVNESDPDSPWLGELWSFFVPPRQAYAPVPSTGAASTAPNVVLSWQPGLEAALHFVYFGTDADAVRTAQGAVPQVATTYTPPLALEPDTTYTWRVDEFAGRFTPGEIWSFRTAPEITVADAELLGWWPCDEPDTGTAVDASGHGLHGLVQGGVAGSTEGLGGAALVLDGSTYLRTEAPADVNTNTATFCAWIRPSRVHRQVAGLLFTRGADNTSGLNLRGDNQLGYHWQGQALSSAFESGLVVPVNEWSFVAAVIEPDQATLYLDSARIWRRQEGEHAAAPFTQPLYIGQDPQGGRLFTGAIDEIRLYRRALSPTELSQLIAAGTAPTGPADPRVVDDFRAYNAYYGGTDPNIWDVWWDGFGGNLTGSTAGYTDEPYLERILTFDGGQSLPFQYNNSGAFFDIDGQSVPATVSEISRDFDPAADWTRAGATGLSLRWRGLPTNTAEPTDGFFLRLTDQDGHSGTVALADAEALRRSGWRLRRVPWEELGAVDPSRIRQLVLGVGSPGSSALGGQGTVLIDAIRLAGP